MGYHNRVLESNDMVPDVSTHLADRETSAFKLLEIPLSLKQDSVK